MFLLGFSVLYLVCVQVDLDKQKVLQFIDQKVAVSGVVSQDVVKKNGTYRITISNISFNYSKNTLKSQVYAMLSDVPEDISRSDIVVLEGILKSGFGDYVGFLYRPKIVSYGKPSPPDYAEQVRSTFSSALRSTINDDKKSNLALGYLVGEKGKMTEDFTDSLRRIGMTHAVVASGFHLGVLINFAKKHLKKISRLCALLGSLMFLVAFVAIAGFSPSLARAGIVTVLSLIAWYFGRRFHPGRIIIYAATISLLINPSYISNLAWQLSFLSYIGILIVAPILTRYFFDKKVPGFLASTIIQSTSAQILCLPVLIYSYGEFSILGIVANLLISPTIAIAMTLSLFAGLSKLANFLPQLIVIPASILLGLHIQIIEKLAQIPWATMKLKQTPVIFMAYPILIIVILIIKRRSNFSFRPVPELEKSEKNGKIYTC